MLGNGSDELIGALVRDLRRAARRDSRRAKIAYAVPGFVVFRTAALAHGLEPVEVPFGPALRAGRSGALRRRRRAQAQPDLPGDAEQPDRHAVAALDGDEAARAAPRRHHRRRRGLPRLLRRQELHRSGAGARQLPRPADAVEDRAGGAARRAARRPARAARRRREGAAALQPDRRWRSAPRSSCCSITKRSSSRTSRRSSEQRRAPLRGARRRLPGLEVFPSGGNFLLVRATAGARAARRARRARRAGAAVRCRACSPDACASPSARPKRIRGCSTPSRRR